MATIEAQIALQIDGELGIRKANDVLLVKLPGAAWSDTEHTTSRSVAMAAADYPDPLAADIVAIHADMMAERAAGEPNPVRVHPFAVLSSPDANGHAAMVERSTVQLDLDALTAAERAATLDRGKKTGILRVAAAVKLKSDVGGTR